MAELTRVLEAVRALTFGGLVGAGLGAIFYYLFSPSVSFINQYAFIALFSGFGTFTQQAIRLSLRPILGFAAFQLRLLEIRELERRGRIDHAKAQELVNKLCEKRFLE